MLAKILIKERENYVQLADFVIDYFEGDLCYPVYGGKQTSVLKKGCEVLEKKQQNLKESQVLQVTFVLKRNMAC